MPINPILNGANSVATDQVSVKTTQTSIVPPRSTRRGVIFQNITGSDTVYLGIAGVSTGHGYPLPASPNATIYIPTTAAIYGIVATTAQTVAFLEIYD